MTSLSRVYSEPLAVSGVLEPEALGSQCTWHKCCLSASVMKAMVEMIVGREARATQSKFCLSGEREFPKELLLLMPKNAEPHCLFSF